MPSYTFADVMKMVPAMPVIAPFGTKDANSKYESPDAKSNKYDGADGECDGDVTCVSRTSSQRSPAAASALLGPPSKDGDSPTKGTPDSSVSPKNAKKTKDAEDAAKLKSISKSKDSNVSKEQEKVVSMCRVPTVIELLASCDDNLHVKDDEAHSHGMYLDREIAEAVQAELQAFFSGPTRGKCDLKHLGELTTSLRERVNGVGKHLTSVFTSAPKPLPNNNSCDLLDLGMGATTVGASTVGAGSGSVGKKRYLSFGPWAVIVCKNKEEAAGTVALPRALRYIMFEPACTGMPVVMLIPTGRGDC